VHIGTSIFFMICNLLFHTSFLWTLIHFNSLVFLSLSLFISGHLFHFFWVILCIDPFYYIFIILIINHFLT
jgi:hypothetical protein